MTRTRRQRLQARLGAGLIAASTALALVAIPIGGGAQEEPEPQPVTVEAEALYARSSGRAAPDEATSGFPPNAACLVAAWQIPNGGAICGEQTAPVTDPIDQQLQENDPEETPDDQAPQQPVAPNTYTVAQSSGENRYASGFKFALPEIPEDHELVSATLVLSETQPTYHTSSPAFRQAVLAAFTLDQEAAREELTKIVTDPERYPPSERDLGEVGAEICPFTEPIEEGTHAWEDTPETDCIFGSNGVRDADNGVWTFDLTFALQAWLDGSLENHGLYLRETAAPNLAYGDADSTWQTQISWGAKDNADVPGPQVALETAAAPEPVEFEPLPAPGNADPGGGSPSQGRQGGFFGAPPPLASGQAAPSGPGPTPDVALQPQPAPAGDTVAAPVPVRAEATTPWWVWLLVPTFAAGMATYSRSLTSDLEVVTDRSGAMTRLIEQRTGDGAASAPGPVSFQV